MNITDQITDLLKEGVITITIGTTPKGARFVQAQQAVQTGPGGNCQQIMHQVEGNLPDCINALKDFVKYANEKRTLISIPRSN